MRHLTFLKISFITLFFTVNTFAASKEMFATIDSIAGSAEIQKAGQQKWEKAILSAKLRGNDIVKVLDKSFVRLGLPDGSSTFIRANSQIMVNFFDSSEPNIFSTHVTVLFGAVFFVIKEVLPKALTKTFDTKVFSPTTVVSVRGTSFCVEVDGKNGATSVKVINGTVQVRNILKDAMSFISPGFKTTIEIKTDPIAAAALLDNEITDLKSWVPPPVFDKEIAAQLAKALRDHQVLSGDFKDKFIVMPFYNRSKYSGKWNLGDGFAEHMAEQLKLSNKNVVIPKLDSISHDPLKIGEVEKARFVITGDIEEFDITQHAEITASADEYKEFYIAKVRLRIQLIDVAGKKAVFENVFIGETRGKNAKDNSWQKISTFPFSPKDQRFAKSILGSSTQQAIDQSIEKIVQWANFE
jgi:hypothetical protein